MEEDRISYDLVSREILDFSDEGDIEKTKTRHLKLKRNHLLKHFFQMIYSSQGIHSTILTGSWLKTFKMTTNAYMKSLINQKQVAATKKGFAKYKETST